MSFPTSGGNRYQPLHRMMVFIDGENLVIRYQEMCSDGRKPASITEKPTHYHKDIFVWHPNTISLKAYEVIRATYYTSSPPNEETIESVISRIRKLNFRQPHSSDLSKTLSPWIVKKHSKTRKSKGVDIKMAVDILTHCHAGNIDAVYLITGDGDFLPLVKEVIRSGKQVYLAALSKGLNPKLRNYADEFFDLDPIYFADSTQS